MRKIWQEDAISSLSSYKNLKEQYKEIIPEIVTQSETIGETREFLEKNFPNEEPVRYSVDYAKLSVILINSVKEQQQQIEELKERINKLENNV